MQQINNLPPEFFEGDDIFEEMDKRLAEEQAKIREGLSSELTMRREFYKTQEEFLAAKNKYSHKPK